MLLEQELGNAALSLVIRGRDAEKSAAIVATLDETSRHIYQQIAMSSFKTVWITMAALAGLAFILVLWPDDLKLATTTEPPVEESDSPSESSVDV